MHHLGIILLLPSTTSSQKANEQMLGTGFEIPQRLNDAWKIRRHIIA
jgi:hypothetical protein